MLNMQALMKQAQNMQKKMEEAQKQLEQEEVLGSAGGGAVKIALNGKFEMKKLEIDPSLIEKDEKEMLEDLILTAYNDAKNKVDALTADNMKNVTGGLKLPF